MPLKKIIVIGSGFAGLASAALLAKEGFDVTIIEKNAEAGGRARLWEKDGFKFDMGPSWYWMPDVFENYFSLFGKAVADFYELKRLDPGYKIYFAKNDEINVPSSMNDIENLFEQLEANGRLKLQKFLKQAKYKYEVGMGDYVFKPSLSITEYLNPKLLAQSFGIQMLTGMSRHIRKYFKNSKLIKLLEFPVLFLGATPSNTPAMYSMMNYADLALGTWYPLGGMHKIVDAMVKVAKNEGVKFSFNEEAISIVNEGKYAKGVQTNLGFLEADVIVANADYQHTDQNLTDKKFRNYTPEYWDKRVLSPSSLLFYVGLNKKVHGISHHNLFFDEDFLLHAEEIYSSPKWPSKPLFYVSCTSKTDKDAAPEGFENLFFLIPVAPGLKDTDGIREKYFNLLLDRFEAITGQSIRDNIIVKRSYAHRDFISDYHSFKGNAYGLANTLRQTAFLKPKMRSSKIKNLFFTGQLTVPGPGVPPALISGQVVAKEVTKYIRTTS